MPDYPERRTNNGRAIFGVGLLLSGLLLLCIDRTCRRFHCASPLADSIAASILEDREFHTLFLERSRSALHEHQAIATRTLEEAGIPFAPSPYVHLSCLSTRSISPKTLKERRILSVA
jgi:hypothetical protein